MSRTLILELPDAVFEAIHKAAEASHISPMDLAVDWLVSRATPFADVPETRLKSQMTDEEKQAARERFRRHAGSLSLGYATGSDNEGIDADLAREYEDRHEEIA